MKMKIFYEKYKHAIPALIYGAVYLRWFAWLEQNVTTNYHIIHMAIDDRIPFNEVFIVPYLLWFAYVLVGVLYFFFTDKNDYYKLCTVLATGMTAFLIISTLWPNGHHLRLDVMPRDNIFSHMVAALWKTDTPTNIWPSIHVYNSLAVHFAVMQSKQLEKKHFVRIGSFILCVSIILSTVFLKQHSMFDVLTAFLLGGIMYLMVYQFDMLRTTQRVRGSNHKVKPQIN